MEAKRLSARTLKFAKIFVVALVLGALYWVATLKHAERDETRRASVQLTPACAEKLQHYGLSADRYYRSPYVRQRTGASVQARGYAEEDVRAIQRGCNIVDDLQGRLATDTGRQRWNATRFLRGTHSSCVHCHQGVGDKQDAAGNRLVGSNGLAASWVMADTYDRFTGLLLPYELRQMQCYINSSNGFKPNIADDLIRDVTAYSRFLTAALNLKYGHRYPEQGVDEIPASATLRQGDDYISGKALYRGKCAQCHGLQGLGTVSGGKVIFPAVAGPNSFTLQSRNVTVTSVLPGFICRNMPLGNEGSLDSQQCRDIAYYLTTLPRPAGDREGPLHAVWQRLMMTAVPPLTELAESLGAKENGRTPASKQDL